MYMDTTRLNFILTKSSEYIEKTKPQFMNYHSYLVALNVSQRDINKWSKVQEGEEGYENIQMALDIIEHAKDIIISNILQTQVLNPYSKNGNVAMGYLKIISKEFKEEDNNNDRLNIVIKSGNGPISIHDKGGKK